MNNQAERERWARAFERNAKSHREMAAKLQSGDRWHGIATNCAAKAEECERWAKCFRSNETPEEEITRLVNAELAGVSR